MCTCKTFESLLPCANSPHLTTIRSRARVSTSTCLFVENRRKREEKEEKDKEEKEDVNFRTHMSSERDTRDTRTEPRCALERSSWTTELFVVLTSWAFYWLDGWEEETWRGKPVPPRVSRGGWDDDKSEGEKEREEERSTSRNCMCGWEETYGARSCHAVQLCAIVTSSVVYPHVPYCPFFSFFFWEGGEFFIVP